MKGMKLGILLVMAIIVLVSVASATVLPSTVTATVVKFGTNSYVDVKITDGGNDDLPNASYTGWCSDSQAEFIDLGPNAIYFPYDTRYQTTPGDTVQWDKINYILNNDAGYSKGAIQQAIWEFDGGRADIPAWNAIAPYNENDVQTLINAANANGAGYVPTSGGQKFAVYLYNREQGQPIFIVATIPQIPVPEFPTLALPIGILIGVVGVVTAIKTREE